MNRYERKKAALDDRHRNGGMGIDEYDRAIARWKLEAPKRTARKPLPPKSTMPDHAVIPDGDEDKLAAEEKVERAYIEDQIKHEIVKKC